MREETSKKKTKNKSKIIEDGPKLTRSRFKSLISQLDKLNMHLSLLSEQITDDKRIRDQLILLNNRLETLGSQIINISKEQQNAISTDLRSLAGSIDRLVSKKIKGEK